MLNKKFYPSHFWKDFLLEVVYIVIGMYELKKILTYKGVKRDISKINSYKISRTEDA